MKFTHLIITCALLLCSLIPANARLGETYAQCKARYGDIVAVAGNEHKAVVGGVVVTMSFWDGTCGLIHYRLKNGKDMSLEVMRTLINTNCSTQEWDIQDGVTLAIKEVGVSKNKKYTWATMYEDHTRQVSLMVAFQAAIDRGMKDIKKEELQQIEGL